MIPRYCSPGIILLIILSIMTRAYTAEVWVPSDPDEFETKAKKVIIKQLSPTGGGGAVPNILHHSEYAEFLALIDTVTWECQSDSPQNFEDLKWDVDWGIEGLDSPDQYWIMKTSVLIDGKFYSKATVYFYDVFEKKTLKATITPALHPKGKPGSEGSPVTIDGPDLTSFITLVAITPVERPDLVSKRAYEDCTKKLIVDKIKAIEGGKHPQNANIPIQYSSFVFHFIEQDSWKYIAKYFGRRPQKPSSGTGDFQGGEYFGGKMNNDMEAYLIRFVNRWMRGNGAEDITPTLRGNTLADLEISPKKGGAFWADVSCRPPQSSNPYAKKVVKFIAEVGGTAITAIGTFKGGPIGAVCGLLVRKCLTELADRVPDDYAWAQAAIATATGIQESPDKDGGNVKGTRNGIAVGVGPDPTDHKDMDLGKSGYAIPGKIFRNPTSDGIAWGMSAASRQYRIYYYDPYWGWAPRMSCRIRGRFTMNHSIDNVVWTTSSSGK